MTYLFIYRENEKERERERERDCYFRLPKYNIINISREGGPEREDVRERERLLCTSIDI